MLLLTLFWFLFLLPSFESPMLFVPEFGEEVGEDEEEAFTAFAVLPTRHNSGISIKLCNFSYHFLTFPVSSCFLLLVLPRVGVFAGLVVAVEVLFFLSAVTAAGELGPLELPFCCSEAIGEFENNSSSYLLNFVRDLVHRETASVYAT